MQTWQKFLENPGLWQKYFIREKIICAIREFFYKEKFHEVETPLLVPSIIPESYLTPFETYLYLKDKKRQKLYLTASPEASIKKLLAAGMGDCFEITKSFRNNDIQSPLRNPEFTILEWYRVNADYKKIMEDCEKLIIYIYQKLKTQMSKIKTKTKNFPPKRDPASGGIKLHNLTLIYQNHTVDLTPPWKRISVDEALQRYCGISSVDLTTKSQNDHSDDTLFPLEKIMKIALKKGYRITKNNTWEEIFNQIFLNEVEPQLARLRKPVFLYDYPLPLASLAKIKSTDPKMAERFELYIGGLELANCFSELIDFEEQKRRFGMELNYLKQKKGIEIIPDRNFLKALEMGLPSSSGIALGIDRLAALFTNSSSIDEVLLFPMKDLLA